MRITTFIFSSLFIPLLLGAGCENINLSVVGDGEYNLPKKFQMEITMTKKETQHEGFGNTNVITFDGNHATSTLYHWSLPGTVTQSKQYTLGDRAIANLLAFIKKNKINSNLEEIKPQADKGYAIEVQTKINIDGVETNANIAGMYDWYGEDKKSTELKNLDYYYAVDQIIGAITENKDI